MGGARFRFDSFRFCKRKCWKKSGQHSHSTINAMPHWRTKQFRQTIQFNAERVFFSLWFWFHFMTQNRCTSVQLLHLSTHHTFQLHFTNCQYIQCIEMSIKRSKKDWKKNHQIENENEKAKDKAKEKYRQ